MRGPDSQKEIENISVLVYTERIMAEKKERKQQKKRTGIGLALWILAALIILVFFLVNQNKIAGNLKATGFFSKIGRETPEFVEKAEPKEASGAEKNEVAPLETVEIDLNDIGSHTEEIRPEEKGVLAQNETARRQQEEAAEEKEYEAPVSPEKTEAKPAPEKKETAVKKEVSVKTETAPKMMKLKLFFMTISSNGSVARKEITREMKKSDSPLMDAVNALIQGPDSAEERSGCRSLISDGTKLIGASVRNGIATLNFSGEFEFNKYGIEGLRGQLQQIVFTATAFPTVESVQFLVDGERKEYLGSEGVWIGTPLGRNSF